MATRRDTESETRKKNPLQAKGREARRLIAEAAAKASAGKPDLTPRGAVRGFRNLNFGVTREKLEARMAADRAEAEAVPEELEAREIFARVDRELTTLEERTQRLMHHYGL
jgi:hypothetical protein